MTNYVTLLNNNDLKATFQRINILDVIDKHGHMSVDDIYDEVIKVHPSISLATIYKNIILMMDKGVLTEVPIAERKSKYELTKTDHIHLICTNCGEVIDKECRDTTNSVLSELTHKENFLLNKRQINLYGTCSSCKK
ncbi:Peroxide stress regulator; Ferric uptake regulation protein; Fe2+/Zn2+ uptake regulation proteins [hydrothermal vent metagenome]|uniref:Peroxide stress regulator Ferric uptake regulation protein Fe2+/Zn2+ uptake regulation proteins n=1 Tax=hydrothermal vent metagenome TaxID=652676 RepID=A0A1W1EFR6_9ZZZZ